MVPDLPYDREVVPGDSEGPDRRGRFATVGRGSKLLGRSTLESAGLPVRPRRALRVVLAVTVSTAVCLTVAVSAASADDLDDRRHELESQLARTKSDLSESSASLSQAAVAVDRTEAALAGARSALAQTRQQLVAAAAADKAMARRLTTAQAALVKARAAVVEGQRTLDAQKVEAGEIVRDQYQQHTTLIPIAAMLQSGTTGELATRLQWSTTLFDTTAKEISRLTAYKRQLDVARAKATTLEQQVAADRRAAAANLRTKTSLENKAETQEREVAGLLEQRRAIQDQAADDVAADKRRYAQLNSEAASVEQRIAARIAAAKAAKAAKAAAEAAAARRAAAERAAAERARVEAARAAARAEAKARAVRRAKAKAARLRAEREEAQAREESRRAAAKAKKARERAERSSGSRDSNDSNDNSNAKSDDNSSGNSNDNSSSNSGRSNRESSSSGGGRSASHGFIYPVNAGITSPYGTRFHPILKYWKLHDGTDFGASCGTPIKAAYSGRVAERYFNSGYGNRLMIDHGEVDGRYVTTGYNHASRYTVSVGERVSKGEVIGYVGSTGYSTGCHLHLMVWVDGNRRNPMTWF